MIITNHILYDNNLDGKISASIIYELLSLTDTVSNINYYNIENNDFGIDRILTYDRLYVISNKFYDDELILKALKKECEVIFITSSDYVMKSDFSKEIADHYYSGIIMIKDTNYCLSYLTYLYSYNQYNKGAKLQSDNVPLFFKYIDSYYKWKLNMNNTVEFNYGLKSYKFSIENLFITLFDNDDNIFNINDDRYSKLVYKCIEYGKSIRKYESVNNELYSDSNAFKFTIIDNCGHEYNGLALNSNIDSNIILGKYMIDYELVVTFSFDGSVWTYRFYTPTDYLICTNLIKSIPDILEIYGDDYSTIIKTKELILSDNCTIKLKKN